MIKKIKKIICWPFNFFFEWLGSGLPKGKNEEEEKYLADEKAMADYTESFKEKND